MRGVYDDVVDFGIERRGSSPLARGLLQPVLSAVWAGMDHPRLRGVYRRTCPATPTSSGSSPLARGLQSGIAGDAPEGGIIPACAGFTSPSLESSAGFSDHPRLRGVYAAQEDRARAQGGSSPLARGLRPRLHGDPLNDRIIPACSGFTAAHPVLPLLRADHPRLRGVYHSAADVAYDERGSSPLARGLHATLFSRYFRHRIIPACAGFTGRVDLPHVHVSDHPRLRGVYLKTVDALVQTVGSSPLARGLLGARGIDRAGRRIIPACAGFTGARACSR